MMNIISLIMMVMMIVMLVHRPLIVMVKYSSNQKLFQKIEAFKVICLISLTPKVM